MARRIVPVLASVIGGGSGYDVTEPIMFKPGNASNPEVVDEGAGTEEFRWNHDATPSLYENNVYPFQLVFPEENGYIDLHHSNGGLQVSGCFLPVSPAWLKAVIAHKSLAQNGVLGSWDKYDLVDGQATISLVCDAVNYVLEGAAEDQGSYLLLWTANNDLYASLYLNFISADDDTVFIAKVVAANPGQWANDGFQIKFELY